MADYYVATTGSDSNAGSFASPFLTIAKGCSMLLWPGDALYIKVGTYSDQRVFEVDLGSSGVLVSGYPGDTVTIEVTGANGCRFQDASRTGVEVRDLIFDGTNDPAVYGVAIGYTAPASHHITFRRVTFKNSHGNGFSGSGSNHQWIDCSAHSNGWLNGAGGDPGSNGLYLGLVTNCLVDGGDFYDNCSYGVRIFESGAGTASGNIFRNGRCRQNGLGRGLGGASASPSGGGGFVLGDTNNIAYNIRCYDNYWGFTSAYSGAPDSISVMNCAFIENDNGVWLFNAGYGSAVIYKNNISRGNSASDLTISAGVTVTQSNNLTGVVVNFVDEAGRDFHLLATALNAIDQGANLTANGVTTDTDGIPRPVGPAFDIGPYEYGGVVPPDEETFSALGVAL